MRLESDPKSIQNKKYDSQKAEAKLSSFERKNI